MKDDESVLNRILGHCIEDERGCWIWQRYLTEKGYGGVTVNGVYTRTHRAVYLRMIGTVPDGYELDHVECQNRACCNPWHLEPVPPVINNWRSARWPGRPSPDHCIRGHRFDSHDGRQAVCTECRRIRGRARRQRLAKVAA